MSRFIRSLHVSLGPRGWLAALLIAALSTLAQAQTTWGLVVRDTGSRDGVEITRIVEGSPAAAAGLQVGDRVLAADGRPVTSADDLAAIAGAVPAGQALNLRVARQGWERTLRLAAPARAASAQTYGLRLGDRAAERPPGTGAVVTAIAAGGPADRAAIALGDVVLRVQGQAVSGAADVDRLVAQLAPDQPLTLVIWREGWERTLTLGAAADRSAAVAPSAAPAVAGTPFGALSDAIEAANAAFADGDLGAAEAGYRRVIALQPKDYTAHARLALIHIRQQRYADAAAAARRSLEIGPAEASTLINLGLSHTMLGEPAAARAAYLRAIELAPGQVEPYAGVANSFYSENDWPQAERYYRLGLERDPQRQSLWEGLAASCGAQNKHTEAAAAYRQAIAIGPSKSHLFEFLGYQLSRLRQYSEAEQALQQALSMEPSDADVHFLLGHVLSDSGKVDAARMAWQRAAELDPSGRTGQLARQNLATLPQARPAPVAPSASVTSREAAGAGASVAPPSAAPVPPMAASEAATGGAKASVAIGDFQVKAAGAVQFIGDGLREMLLTSLHNSGRFVVVERMDIQGLAAEQALSRTRAAVPGSAVAPGQMIVADLMVYGAVTEFGSEQSGSGLQFGVPKVPLRVGRQSSTAHMAIDVRVVDVASGRLLAAQRITGEARSAQMTLGTEFSVGGSKLPASFGAFRNTPMEAAIRECVQKATAYIVQSLPAGYLRHP